TALITTYGTAGSLGMILPSLLVAGLLMAVLPGLSRPLPARSDGRASAPPTMVGAMTLLVLVISIRSWTQLGFTTYMPFYYLEVLKGDPRMVGTLLAVFLGAGAAGTLIAGPIADRIGHRRFMVSVFFLAAALWISALMPILGCAVSLTLPEPRTR